MDAEELKGLKGQLLENAFLFEDPRAYAAGVTDALEAVRLMLEGNIHARPATRLATRRSRPRSTFRANR